MSELAIKDTYRKQGINLVPIPKGSGKALDIPGGWKKYQYEMYTHDIPEDQDFAVILGKISGNLIVLDFDQCDDIEELNNIKKNILNSTLVVRTGDGYHAYLKLSGELPRQANTFLQKGKCKMEVKSEGAYVVGASCNHYDKDESNKYVPTGKKYTIISNTATVATVAASGDMIIEQIKSLGWTAKGHQADGNGQHIIVPTSELEKGGWEHGERYNNGFKLALRRFHSNWNYDDTLNEALTINQTCKPPHTESEVERWVMDAHTQFEKNRDNPDNGYFKDWKDNSSSKGEKDEPNEIEETAMTIMASHHFKCLRDSDELLWWDGKTYKPGIAEPLIKEECEKWIENCSTHARSEVINKIKVVNYVNREDIDADPYILTLDNCVINVRTLETKEHSYSNLTCVSLPVSYTSPQIPEKINVEYVKEYLKGTLFLEYLQSCFTVDGKFDEVQFFTVLEAMACCIIKRQFDKAFMFIGAGANGKSVLLDYIESILGKENVSNIPIHDIEVEKFSKAELFGKMANIFADIESHELKKTSNLKIIISGDSLTVEKKHQHPFKFNPYCKLIFSANRFPYVHDQSDGFFRRFVIIDWKRQFTGNDKDTSLRQKLIKNTEEKNKVFSLLVLIARELDKRGSFLHEKSIATLRKEWNKRSDPIMQFIDAMVTEQENAYETKRYTYTKYHEFCIQNDLPPESISRFGRIFGEYYESEQLKDEKGINRKCWMDIKIKKDIEKQESLVMFDV